MIKLKWLGHSCFRAETEGGAVILDPFAPGSVPGCADIHETADAVLSSHEHHDHNYREGVRLTGKPSPFTVTVLESFHDDCSGEKRGPNLIHILEAGGIRFAHFGDIGCMPAPKLLEKLQGLDAALLPVGGFFTVGPKEAKDIADAVKPRIIIPMHYRSDRFGFDVIGPVDDFLAYFDRVERLSSDTVELTSGMEPGVLVPNYPEI